MVGSTKSLRNRNNNQWTEGRFRSFITSMLRQGSKRWGPINSTKKNARVKRGKYKCAACGTVVGATKVVKGKRVTNIFVDHVTPVVDTQTGFTTWDDYIERLFCEEDNLQLLCKHCHDNKTQKEREERKKNVS